MATIDDINNSFAYDKQSNYPGTAPKQTAGIRPEADASGTVAGSNASGTASGTAAGTAAGSVNTAGGRSLNFQEMYRMLNTYKPPTKEEIEKERRKQKRDMVLASIGNGLNAFHQAYANARGVKPVTDNVSLTGKVRDRYERLKKERDAMSREWANGMLRAAQMDQEQGNWREKLDYQKERDAKADERDKRNFDYSKAKDEQQQENWQKQFDRQGEQWKQEFEQRKKRDGEQSAIAWAQHNLAKQAQKDNKELRQQQIAAQGARGVRGKQLAFSDGNGNSVAIYENVWKGSMEQVYDAIVADFKAQKKQTPNADVPIALPRRATAQQKDDYVKQHWHKSAAGRQMMQTLAGIDPANMTSTTTEDGSGGLGWGSEGNGNNETDW